MQIIHRLPGDYSAMDLVFLNRNPDELFLIKELEEWRHRMGRKNPLTINFVVDHLPAARNPLHIQQGLLTEDMLRRLLATSDGNPPHKDDILLICGPPGLYRHLGINISRQEGLKLTPNSPLLNLGFQQQQVIVFHDQQLMGNG
jgi:NAD(P)H-flavin reductase